MKKIALFFALWFCFFMFFTALSPPTEGSKTCLTSKMTKTIVLPASLHEIEEEAFENTAAESIIFPELLTTIGNRAFARNNALATVYLPESIKYIGAHAFDESHELTIRGVEGSYAAAWAKTHNVPFEQVESAASWITRLGRLVRGTSLFSLSFGYACPMIQFRRRRKTEIWERSMRPQDRTDLYPINYRFP